MRPLDTTERIITFRARQRYGLGKKKAIAVARLYRFEYMGQDSDRLLADCVRLIRLDKTVESLYGHILTQPYKQQNGHSQWTSATQQVIVDYSTK